MHGSHKHQHNKIEHEQRTLLEKLEKHLKEIEHTSHFGIFNELIEIGYSDEHEHFRLFDLTSWDKTQIKGEVDEKSHKKIDDRQYIKIKAIYKHETPLGFTSISMMIVELERPLPVEHDIEHTCLSEFLGCPWKILSVRYCSSMNKLTEIEKIDLT